MAELGRRGRFKTCSSGEGSSPSRGTMKDATLKYFEWIPTMECTPKDGERVLVKQVGWPEWSVQVWNEHYNCWDTGDGDDYDFDKNEGEYWMRII